jgi:hypothetical protein
MPENLQQADAADRMLWAWRSAGRSFPDISTEWERITGDKPGDGSLGGRYRAMVDKFAGSSISARRVSGPQTADPPPFTLCTALH